MAARRGALDAALVAADDATSLKGALFHALKVPSLHVALLRLPSVLEATRRLLSAAPDDGVTAYLEGHLLANVLAHEAQTRDGG